MNPSLLWAKASPSGEIGSERFRTRREALAACCAERCVRDLSIGLYRAVSDFTGEPGSYVGRVHDLLMAGFREVIR